MKNSLNVDSTQSADSTHSPTSPKEISFQERERLTDGLRREANWLANGGNTKVAELLRDAAAYIDTLDDNRMDLERVLNPEPDPHGWGD